MTALWIMAALLTKHFIVDFPLQPKWMYANQGTFGHLGGIAHAALHQAATWLILLAFGIDQFIVGTLATAEYCAHYLIDWAKLNLNARMGWGPNTSEKFWWLLGLDQWLHGMTYVAIVWWVL